MKVVGWYSSVHSLLAGSPYTLVLAGPYPVPDGIWNEDPALAAQIEGYRNSGTTIRVWGQVLCGIPDANGCQIQVRG